MPKNLTTYTIFNQSIQLFVIAIYLIQIRIEMEIDSNL